MVNPTSSAGSISSRNNRNNYDYQIFINCHHHDHVLKTFPTSLYKSLCSHNLRVFLNGQKQSKGKSEDAIRTASLHIAIFSPGYAESTECLDQLLLMLETGQQIIPVFFRVEGSKLRRTRDLEPYDEALDNKEKNEVGIEITGKWRQAIRDVSNKKGLKRGSYNGDEGHLINQIVERVTKIFCAYDVFINNAPDPDIQKKFASHLYSRLLFHGRRVFLDKKKFEGGDNLTPQITGVIENASVRIAILSTKYVDSSCCLNELLSMVKSGKTIIPVFYRVKPSEVRWQIGAYSKLRRKIRAFSKLLSQKGLCDLLLRRLKWQQSENGHGLLATKTVDSDTVENWEKALFKVAEISGFELDECNGDEGLLVNKIVQEVLSSENATGKTAISYDVFICHRGPDSKNTLASHLYHRLVASGLRPFLDRESLQKGQELTSQIKKAIKNASVQIVIFSKYFGESEWCLKELEDMLKTKADIIPVFYNVDSSYLRETYRDGDLVYSRALLKLKETYEERPRFPDLTGLYNRLIKGVKSGPIVPRYTPSTIVNWSKAIFDVAGKPGGFHLQNCDGDEGVLLDNVVKNVVNRVNLLRKKRSNRRRRS